ncbi:MAG: leucine-rich repeat protein [Clostridia bacterium]|nr:leucine-rich repeat protein [Clostridia bacterium]
MKKTLLFSLMLVILACLFAFVISAEEATVDDADFVGGKLYTGTTNEFGTVNQVVDTSTVYYYSKTLDTTSRIVLKNSDGTYSTYPTIYIMYTVTDYQGPRWGFDKLNAITGQSYDINSVARIEFPEGTNVVRGSSFRSSTELVYVKIASTIREVKGNAFQECSNLAKVEFRLDFEKYPEFGSNLQSINNGAVFNECTSLTELILPNSVTKVQTGAISGCTKLKYFNPGASFTETNNQPIGYPQESFILSKSYKGNYMLFSYDKLKNAAAPATLVFYYTGTLEQAKNLQEIETQCYEIKYGTLVSYDEFTSADFVRDASVHYFVYGYNHCDAFYGGEHKVVNVNSCVSTCTVCGDTIVNHDKNAEKVTIAYENGYSSVGLKTTTCTNEGCTHNVAEKAPELFSTNGYSVPENGRGEIAICFVINYDAIAEFERVNTKTLKYGAFAIAYDRIGTDGIYGNQNAICADIDEDTYVSFEMRISGFNTEAQKEIKLSFGAYVIDEKGEVSYLQADSPNEGDTYHYITYKDIANKPTQTE